MEPELSSIKKVKQYRRPAERPFTAEERDKMTIFVGGADAEARGIYSSYLSGKRISL
jgi:hypothetical protein